MILNFRLCSELSMKFLHDHFSDDVETTVDRLLIRENITVALAEDSSTEAIWVSLRISAVILIVIFYRPPNSRG